MCIVGTTWNEVQEPMTTAWESAGRTDVGRVRSKNEDALLIREEKGLFAVADGMGGAPGGDVASRRALDALDLALDRVPSVAGMEGALIQAQESVQAASAAEPALRGLGTTLTALHVDPSGAYVLGHVGDSRAYAGTRTTFRRLTRDHTWIQDRVDEGAIDPDNASEHPMRHVLTRVVGDRDRVVPDLEEGVLEAGSHLLLCTDGLTACVGFEELESAFRESESIQNLVNRLVGLALDRGAPDNVTVMAVRFTRAAERPSRGRRS